MWNVFLEEAGSLGDGPRHVRGYPIDGIVVGPEDVFSTQYGLALFVNVQSAGDVRWRLPPLDGQHLESAAFACLLTLNQERRETALPALGGVAVAAEPDEWLGLSHEDALAVVSGDH